MKTRPMHTLLSVLTIPVGFVLMTYMIAVESEPGAIPLLLVVVGMGSYVVARVRTRSHRKQPH